MIKLLNILNELKIQPDFPKLIMSYHKDYYGNKFYWVQEITDLLGEYTWDLISSKTWRLIIMGKKDLNIIKSYLNKNNIPYKVIKYGEEYYLSVHNDYVEIKYTENFNNIFELKIQPESYKKLIASKIYIGSDNYYFVSNLNSTYYESWYRDKNDSLTFVVKQDASGELDVKEHFEEITNEIKSLDIPYTYTYDDYEDEYYVKVSAYYINYKN